MRIGRQIYGKRGSRGSGMLAPRLQNGVSPVQGAAAARGRAAPGESRGNAGMREGSDLPGISKMLSPLRADPRRPAESFLGMIVDQRFPFFCTLWL